MGLQTCPNFKVYFQQENENADMCTNFMVFLQRRMRL